MHRRSWLLPPVMLLLAVADASAAALRCPGGGARELELAAELALARAEWPRAARMLACAAGRSGETELAERAARVALEQRQPQAAVAAARRWLALAPDSETARRHLAIALLRNYEDAAAAREFAPLLGAADANRGHAFGQLLAVLVEEENSTGAARVLDDLAAADPSLPEAWYAVSVLWQRADSGARALAGARRALELRPDWRQARQAEVRALLTLGRRDEALALSAALATDDDAQARFSHAWLLLGAGRRDEAVALFGALRREGPMTREALEALGIIAIDDGRIEDALRVFGELARDQHGDGVAWHLGRIAELRGELALAARHFERVTSGPRAVAAQLRAWRLYRELGLPERAELLLDEFLATAPGTGGEVVAGVAARLMDDGQDAAAIGLLDRALRYQPDGDLLFTRAVLRERSGQVRAAIADLRTLVARRPGSPDARNALGYTLVDHGLRLREGHALIEQALAARPDSFAIQDSKGWALVRLGRPAEGLPWLERAYGRSRDPEIAAHFGEALWQLGREAEARSLWERALAEHPDSKPLQRAIGRRAPR